MFTMGLGTLVFSPTWFLTDAGIVYSNEERVTGTDEPVEGRTVGGRFTDFLRGYAGIGVVFSYIQFLSVYFGEQTIPPNPLDIAVVLLFFLGLPIFLLTKPMRFVMQLEFISNNGHARITLGRVRQQVRRKVFVQYRNYP